MQYETFDHRKAKSLIPAKFQKEVAAAITSAKPRKPIKTQKIRESIFNQLQECGWSDGIRIDPTNSKIDITSIRADVGLCLQTGNMSRFYADILKLQTLYAEKKIKAAIYIAPQRAFARSIGQNLVNFERFVRELEIFYKTVTVPILIYGIEE